MRFCAISDVHGFWDLLAFPRADVLLVSGDLTNGSWKEVNAALKLLRRQPYKATIVIAGNNDECLDIPHLDHVKSLFAHSGAVYLCHEAYSLTMDGQTVNIFGSPYTPKFSGMGFERYEDELEELCKDIPDGLDLLMTHGPALGILDKNGQKHESGSEALRRAVDAKKPRVHVFGHIHESRGFQEGNGVLSVNASSIGLDAKNKLFAHKPFVFDILPDGAVKMISME